MALNVCVSADVSWSAEDAAWLCCMTVCVCLIRVHRSLILSLHKSVPPQNSKSMAMICRYSYIDEGVLGSGMELFLIGGPPAKDSATKLKGGQLNVCTVYCVLSFPPVAEICARLAGNFCQKVDNSKF
jgi:hypothetical protein